MPYYLDTSAAVKLVVAERGSAALARWLGERDGDIVASDLLRTELLRTTRRVRPDAMTRARAVLDAVTLIELSTPICERAALLDPAEMRSLDALHLATALELGDHLAGVVTYDERMATAAGSLGLAVIAPA